MTVPFNKVCVVGCGAIGGWLGAGLARAGCQVSVFARGATLAALQTHGLRMGDAQHAVSLERVKAYIEETIDQIHNYLGLSMTVSQLSIRDGLIGFAAE